MHSFPVVGNALLMEICWFLTAQCYTNSKAGQIELTIALPQQQQNRSARPIQSTGESVGTLASLLNCVGHTDAAGVQPTSRELPGASIKQCHVSVTTLTTELVCMHAPLGIHNTQLTMKLLLLSTLILDDQAHCQPLVWVCVCVCVRGGGGGGGGGCLLLGGSKNEVATPTFDYRY